MKTFTVLYKTGGKVRYQWHRVYELYLSMEAAVAKANEIRRQGYETLIHDTTRLDAIGMPE